MPTHTHPCGDCKEPLECDGQWERNYDGFPEAVCTIYHLLGAAGDWLCHDCRAKRDKDDDDAA
jgi:hypothetical protein